MQGRVAEALHAQFHQIQPRFRKLAQYGGRGSRAQRVRPGGTASAIHFPAAAVSRVQGKGFLPLLCGQGGKGAAVEGQFDTLFRPDFIQKRRRRPQIPVHIAPASCLTILRAEHAAPRTARKGEKNGKYAVRPAQTAADRKNGLA